MWRVFMCTAGTSGEHGCATSEIPLAQKRGSSAAPGMSPRNSGENSPVTVEMLTPTFSKTRPRMTAVTPPPPSARCHGVRSNRPGAAPACGRCARNSSSIASNAAQMRSRSAANQAAARSQRSGSGGKVAASVMSGMSPVWRSASASAIAPASATLSDRAGARKGITTRASAARCTAGGAPALSRPRRIVSSGANAKRWSGNVAEVVISTRRDCGSRAARNSFHEPCRATRQRAA